MGKYSLTKNKKGQFHFNLLAGNAEPILSSQTYATKKSALNGIASVTKNAPEAPVVDLTAKNPAEEKNPKFEIFGGKDGKFYFRLRAANGQNIGSSEGYNSLASCKNGIKSVKKNAESPVVEAED